MIEDPNSVLKEILREEDPDYFGKLETELNTLRQKLCAASDEKEKKHIRRQLQSVQNQVDAVIRFARSV